MRSANEVVGIWTCQDIAKGQIKPKADWRAIDSPKKQTNEFVFYLYSPEILETETCYCLRHGTIAMSHNQSNGKHQSIDISCQIEY